MNVASLELCRELYELSGWNDEIPFHYTVGEEGILVGLPRKAIKGCVEIPAYDLGYLLRKLPDGVELTRNNSEYWYVSAKLEDDTKLFRFATADTPEDAACKLAIELFKSGVLQKQTPAPRKESDV